MPGTCLPCPLGFSSAEGGICVKCPIGQEAFPGGPCTDCPAGFGADVGGLCGPCPGGQSSFSGGACIDCPSGQFSFSGGLCTDCPAGFSSTPGTSECFACSFGQVSVEGGLCINRCQAGQAWSNLFQQCAICPVDSFSRPGDATCTRCPHDTFAPQESSSCYSTGKIGAKMRIDTEFSTFYLPEWRHAVANVLQSEIEDIEVLYFYAGSVIIDFQLNNPEEDFTIFDSQVRRLSGNEKTLLLYQWWLTGDDRISDFPWDIEDFKLFAETATSDGTDDLDVVQLFAPSSPLPPVVFAPRPDPSDDVSMAVQSRFYFDQTTLKLDVAVDSGSAMFVCWALTISLLVLFI